MSQCISPLHHAGVQPPATLPDEELIARICHRDEPALETIYARYQSLIFSIGLRITGDYAVTEEIVQDTFQAVWQSARSFQPDRSFSTWLMSIARHRAIDVTRSRSFICRVREKPLEEQLLVSRNSDIEALSLHVELHRALALLPTSQRDTIILAFFAGLTHVEIAAYMHTPLGTVKSRIQMGMARLREAVDMMEL